MTIQRQQRNLKRDRIHIDRFLVWCESRLELGQRLANLLLAIEAAIQLEDGIEDLGVPILREREHERHEDFGRRRGRGFGVGDDWWRGAVASLNVIRGHEWGCVLD